MSYSLQEFCHDARSILSRRDDHHGRDQVRQAIEVAQDSKFARVTGRDLSEAPRRVFDPETGAVRHSDGVETRRVRDGDD